MVDSDAFPRESGKISLEKIKSMGLAKRKLQKPLGKNHCFCREGEKSRSQVGKRLPLFAESWNTKKQELGGG